MNTQSNQYDIEASVELYHLVSAMKRFVEYHEKNNSTDNNLLTGNLYADIKLLLSERTLK